MRNENLILDLPKAKETEQELYDFAIDIARRIIENPVAVRNGFRMGQTVRPLTRLEKPFQTLANAEATMPSILKPDAEVAFCVSAVAGRLYDKHSPKR